MFHLLKRKTKRINHQQKVDKILINGKKWEKTRSFDGQPSSQTNASVDITKEQEWSSDSSSFSAHHGEKSSLFLQNSQLKDDGNDCAGTPPTLKNV